jgi:hypothetical protein
MTAVAVASALGLPLPVLTRVSLPGRPILGHPSPPQGSAPAAPAAPPLPRPGSPALEGVAQAGQQPGGMVMANHVQGVIYLLHFDRPYRHASHYTGKAASSGLLKAVWQVSGDEFAELAWMARMGPPGAPGTLPAPRHRLPVVGACMPGAVVGTAVLLGAVAAGAVVVGAAAGAVVVAADPDGDVVDVPGARVAGGVDRSPPATTTPTEVLPPGRGWVPTKLASGWLATASTPVIAATAIPKASTAATATRCQRIGWGWAWLAPSSLAPSSLAPSSLESAWSPTRRRRERRATWWADVSEWLYTASAGVTSRLTSAAPIRVPSTPKKDAMTAPLTAASAPASNLGMRSCSIPHLEVGVGTAALPCGGPRARPDGSPAAAWGAPTLATQAASRQLPPGQEGDRAAWGSCGLGDRFLVDRVQRAELQAAKGPGGPGAAYDPEHVAPPRVHQSQRACIVSDCRAEILLIDQESCSSMRACRARWLSRDNARAALSNAPTNSRPIQHWVHSPTFLEPRLGAHRDGVGARLMAVIGEAGIDFQLAAFGTATGTTSAPSSAKAGRRGAARSAASSAAGAGEPAGDGGGVPARPSRNASGAPPRGGANGTRRRGPTTQPPGASRVWLRVDGSWPPPAHRHHDPHPPRWPRAGTGLACGAARGNPAPARGPAGCLLDGLPPGRRPRQGRFASLRDRLRRPLTRSSSRRPGETRSPGAGEEQPPTSRQDEEVRP